MHEGRRAKKRYTDVVEGFMHVLELRVPAFAIYIEKEAMREKVVGAQGMKARLVSASPTMMILDNGGARGQGVCLDDQEYRVRNLSLHTGGVLQPALFEVVEEDPSASAAQDGQNDAEHEGGVAEPVESKVRGVEWLEPAAIEASETAGRS